VGPSTLPTRVGQTPHCVVMVSRGASRLVRVRWEGAASSAETGQGRPALGGQREGTLNRDRLRSYVSTIACSFLVSLAGASTAPM
jgi:hypothetical protein